MKKVLFVFMYLLAMAFTSAVVMSCDTEDEDTYYAGESEEDYKPNTYTITATFDLSNVSGLSSSEIEAAEKTLNSTVNVSQTFNTKADAVSAFDEMVANVASDSDLSSIYKGAKVTFYLKRGTAIIKKSTVSW